MRRDVGNHFKPGQWTKICSLHFLPTDFYNFFGEYRTLREDAVPSIFPFETKKSTPRRQLVRVGLDKSSDESSMEQSNEVSQTTSDGPGPSSRNTLKCMREQSGGLEEANAEVTRLKKRLDEMKLEIIELKKCVSRKRFSFELIRESDKDVNNYTGLPSAAVFDALLDFLSPGRKRSNVVYRATAQKWTNDDEAPGEAEWREREAQPGRPASLSQEDELFLVLVRLRLNLKEYDLAHCFEVSQSSVSRIFSTWINYCYLRLGMLPCWPDRTTIQNTMPATFKEQYPNTTAIVDATEIKVDTPSSLLLQSQTYSSYKSTNTFKGLFTISPAGHMIFVSSLCTGSISDVQLVERSGFLNLLQPGDEVMADRGFTIENLLTPLGVGLNIPPFLGSRQQMDAGEVVETQQIASLRIHLERAIWRVKEFDILSGTMPASVAGSANQIWTVCCLLCNFQDPLISC
ncbi:uncharacterized protein [Dysidea avara]|uniref:uncharacterized protein isoform X2 n=1 Tax=Dysidea avara TaxID=196820 RepID=UPI00332B7611